MLSKCPSRAPPRGTLTLIAAAAFAAAALTTTEPAAQSRAPVCTSYLNLTKQLAEKHSEKPVGMGLASNGAVVQLFRSPDGETWTVVMRFPNGIACLMAAGNHWEDYARALKGPGV